MALWGGRFSQGADSRFKQFNDSLRFDYRLAEQDIQGSMAWAKALVKVGVLTSDEQGKLQQAMEVLLASVQQDPQQILSSDAEDIHSWVESALIAAVGDLGKKLHTGRSRNDQVATDLKLWCKAQGELLLSSPLGNTLLAARWTPLEAVLEESGKTRRFSNIDALIEQSTGAALPVAALGPWAMQSCVTPPGDPG